MATHYKKSYNAPGNSYTGRPSRNGYLRPQWRPLFCQRFFPFGGGSSFFAVTAPPTPCRNRLRQVQLVSESEFTRA
ncbi:hypothetical protein PHISCL_09981 [Aspergillus sclerotialis]|uniref:Uncharacterized protein n=1 Tax=Aspergillus sclerotialis TaxID=2070753 RepID=A0A3A2Z3N4_9EURO|nr:hypothetical protein PHISCL_09981 [Aspergillus sclerotialis]